MAKRTLTNAAKAAAMIRKELKRNDVAGATVRSKNYSGGSSINVSIPDPLPATLREVKAYCAEYQYGYFDGMQDLYEYSNTRKDIPQVSYVFVNADYSDELKQSAWEFARGYFASFRDMPYDYAKAQNMWTKDGEQVSQFVYQILSGYRDTGFWSTRKPHIKAAA